MNKRTLRAAMLVFMLIPTMASAQQVAIRGAGMSTCGSWVSGDRLDRLNSLSWVLGFVSAASVFRAKEFSSDGKYDAMNGADADAIELWITNYCSQNPLKKLWNASTAMLIEASK
ncbi:hypothetical protein MZK49_05550 [Ensifer sesbaniae]|uniref:hypothetical protein n=1 Tax=Ensifer sesbaniae TaxID=1214071 RepID=UPI0020018A36|nr:hypothetical protein [Ensifer sesbaniae]